MLRMLLALVLATACGVGRAATIDVYAYNTEFSINLPGGPVQSPVISVGDTIRWVWIQGGHTTTSVAGSAEQWNAPLDSSHPTFSYTFNSPGVFWFYCIPHGADDGDGTASGMSGTVTVLPGGLGACCTPVNGCILTSPADCLSLGGTYQGDGTTCDDDPCATGPITIEIVADQDNVLFQTVDGSTSNALGRYLHVGNMNNGGHRRAVVRFDLSAVPPGSTVIDAELRLFCSQSQGATFPVTMKRIMSEWGEGSSIGTGNESEGGPATPGDATWLHTFYPDQFWTTPGGDFVTQASDSTLVSGQNQVYAWRDGTMTLDVQHWVDQPATNFGWIAQGDEASSANTKRFESRNSAASANHPRLIVVYLPSGATGACCLPDGSCEEVSAAVCATMGGSYAGDGTTCGTVDCPVELEPFVDALPLPGVAQPINGQPGHAAEYRLAITEQFQRLHRDLPLTRVWGYAGSYPGPTIEARRGEPVTVTWINDLRVFETGALRTTHPLGVDECLHGPDVTGQVPYAIVHLHGGKVAPASDGYPELAFPPGDQSPLYTYPNDQPAGTLWYHDHALGITRLNVMMGMAGFYVLRDDLEDALDLPRGAYEIPLAIQDRSFRADGSLRYHEMWHEHFLGDVILVNGKVWPYLNVARGKYRFRMLNGSNSRAYTLGLSNGATFWQIGTDLGLLEAPAPVQEVTILPGERADVVIDFAPYAAGTEIILGNSAPAPFPGFPGVGVVPDVMKFVVQAGSGHVAPLPGSLVEVPRLDESLAITERVLELKTVPNTDCPDHHDPMWTIDGLMWTDDITEFPRLGSIEIWTWKNASGISHPMHLHLVMFQVLDRQAIDVTTGEPTGPRIPPAANEAGWKDTVDAAPGYFTRVIMRFSGFTGTYPFHCHILEHEDHEMMRQFLVVACPADMSGSSDVSDPAYGIPDGIIDASDFFYFLDQFAAGNVAVADLTGSADPNDPAYGVPDGIIDASDFFYFLDVFVLGCP